MEGAADKTYISKRILEQYALERQQRLEQKNSAKAKNLALAAGKTFSEDQSQPAQPLPPVLEEEKKEEEDVVMSGSAVVGSLNPSPSPP